MDIAVGQIKADSNTGQLKIECSEEARLWEVIISLTAVELVAGDQNSEIVGPGFSLDLEGLRAVFDSVDAIGWHSLGLSSDEGPDVFVAGVICRHDVCCCR